MTPFRSEKNTNWEGAFRIPLLVRWPGKIKAGSVCNDIIQHHDWLPTFLAMAGAPDVVDKLKKGYQAIGRTYKNHIDGYNFLPYLTGQAKEGPRKVFFYFSDDGDMLGMRYDNWKLVFMEQRCKGTHGRSGPSRSHACGCPSSSTCAPTPTSSRTSPRTPTTTCSCTTPTSSTRRRRARRSLPQTFKDFPPVQKPNTFTVDDALRKMSDAAAGS